MEVIVSSYILALFMRTMTTEEALKLLHKYVSQAHLPFIVDRSTIRSSNNKILSNSDKRNSLGDEERVSFISCPIDVESLTCIKSEEWKRFLCPNVSFIRVSFIRVRLYSRNCLMASRFVTLKILGLKNLAINKSSHALWLVRSYRRLANKHQLLLCDLLLGRFYCTVVFLRIQAAACSDFLRSEFAAYIPRDTVSCGFWDKSFRPNAAFNRGRPIFGGDFYSKKYGNSN